jgi:4-alpha-glucanotransferase
MIDELAEAAGIAPAYTDYFGNRRLVSPDTKRAILRALGIDCDSKRDAAATARELQAARAAVPSAPQHAYVPPAFGAARQWGFALQLYSLRSRKNWGIGDFADLAGFCRTAAELGAAAVALNPLHQLRLSDPGNPSPYSPSSRRFLNPLYISIEEAERDLGIHVRHPDVRAIRARSLVDYAGVSAVKTAALHEMYESFARAHAHPLRDEFERFVAAGGSTLRAMAAYEQLCAVHGCNGDRWPAEYRSPSALATTAFERRHAAAIAFHQFLQWLADRQLASAARSASAMPAGLYRDLAIGVDAASFDVWSDPGIYARGISAGAPPDPLNEDGQNWGLPPMNPLRLRETAFDAWLCVLRANMRHAGALRIDHVMGLQRLFVIPDGAAAADGAYLAYPFEEMSALLKRESVEHRCLVVGEDLGTIPQGFRERMAQARFFSCRLLYFEDPQTYPHDAVASTGTHDLPPLAAYRTALGISAECSDLEAATQSYRALGRSPAALALLQMEDALLSRKPVNVPGTTTERPNWRRKLAVPIERLQDDVRFATIVETLRESRCT